MAAALMTVSAMAATTFTFTSPDSQTQDGITVSFAKGNGDTAPTWNESYAELRLYASNTITVSGADLSRIDITFSKQGSKGYADLTANCGTLTSAGASESRDDKKTDTWTGNASSVVFTLGASGQRVIYTITVNGEGGNTNPGTDPDPDPKPETGLDENYVYDEPTMVLAQGTDGSNQSYKFIHNNVSVSCTQGAIYYDPITYFGCNANQSLTITATQTIKAVVINGYVKKNFEATASSGDIQFAYNSESEVEANPVVVVKNVNSKTLTINCVKQLRCYEMYVYFEANPDIDVDENNQGGDTPQLYNIAFPYAEAYNYYDYLSEEGEDITIYLYDEEFNYYLQLDLIVPAGTGLDGQVPAGTYQINESLAVGSAVIGFESEEEEEILGCWLTDYINMYMLPLMSGTVTVGDHSVTVNAQYEDAEGIVTVKATYSGDLTIAEGEFVDPEESIENTTQAQEVIKTIENGRLVIRRGENQYDVLGNRL